MGRIDDLVDAIRSELDASHSTKDGSKYDAPMWWARIQTSLDQIKENANTPDGLRKSILTLSYTLIDFGPVSVDIAPSFAKLKQLSIEC